MPHSAVHKWYKQTLGVTGKVTLKFANNLAVPRDLTKSSGLAAASRYQDFILGIMANPLFLGKQCPSEVLATPNLNLTALAADQISYSIQQNGWQIGQESNDYAYIAPQYPSGILIAEFGFNPFMESEKKPVEQLYDLERSLYHEGFLKETLKSMHLDGVNVIGGNFVDNNEFESFEISMVFKRSTGPVASLRGITRGVLRSR
ncbi:unnamed protein product [Aureobasidium pullulans]|nr:unnamed protein product [Aureobasidium pullulans]